MFRYIRPGVIDASCEQGVCGDVYTEFLDLMKSHTCMRAFQTNPLDQTLDSKHAEVICHHTSPFVKTLASHIAVVICIAF